MPLLSGWVDGGVGQSGAILQSSGHVIHAVAPDLLIHEGDILYFVGAMEHLPGVCEEFSLRPLITADVTAQIPQTFRAL
eukprot:1499657-Pyramimonas_sp.AAC.2